MSHTVVINLKRTILQYTVEKDNIILCSAICDYNVRNFAQCYRLRIFSQSSVLFLRNILPVIPDLQRNWSLYNSILQILDQKNFED